jgi:hypothetical protein
MLIPTTTWTTLQQIPGVWLFWAYHISVETKWLHWTLPLNNSEALSKTIPQKDVQQDPQISLPFHPRCNYQSETDCILYTLVWRPNLQVK